MGGVLYIRRGLYQEVALGLTLNDTKKPAM